MPETGTKRDKEGHPLNDLMDMVAGKAADQASTPVMMFLLAGLVLVFGILGVKMALARRKLVRLESNLRKSEEERKQVREDVKLEENQTRREALELEDKALTKDILALKARIVKRDQAHKDLVSELNSVTSWDDLKISD